MRRRQEMMGKSGRRPGRKTVDGIFLQTGAKYGGTKLEGVVAEEEEEEEERKQ
jgi:hypothetical protein